MELLKAGRRVGWAAGGGRYWRMGTLGPLSMASPAPRASLPSPHPGGSRDGKEKGADGGDTEFHPQSQPGWPRSGWGRVSILVPRRSLQAACGRPLLDRPHSPSRASSASVRPRLARKHLEAPDVRVISRAPSWSKAVCAQQGVQLGFGNKVGCGESKGGQAVNSSLLLPTQASHRLRARGWGEAWWGPGGALVPRSGTQNGLRGRGSWPPTPLRPGPGLHPVCLAGLDPHYSRVPVGLMGEAAPELSLPPAASFSFLPLYWPMKEPSSLNWTSTLPP